MPIPGPGTAVSMNTIAGEFGGTVPHSLNEYYRGGGLVPNTPGNAAIPTSGQISMGSFYGSANRISIALTIGTNTQNYDVYANRGPTYVAGSSDITVTVNPGIIVGSSTVPAYAMLVPSGFNPADTVTIVNNGVIQGMGGSGGNGSGGPAPSNTVGPGSPGGSGGNAIYVNRPTTITNNGTVAGGGGGGGGGGAAADLILGASFINGGGGGGGGAGNSGGSFGLLGTDFPGTPRAAPGSAGTSTAGGSGGTGSPAPSGAARGGPGGSGGGRGAAGSNGSGSTGIPAPGLRPGGSGGAAGNYIVGNPFVTWPVTGTREGGVA